LRVSLAVLILAFLSFRTETSAQPIDDAVLKSVIQITTAAGSIGTGFLFGFPAAAQKKPGFVITNKHVIGNYNPIDGDFDHYEWIILHLYRNQPEDDGPVEKLQVRLKTPAGKLDASRVAVHPDRTVDVAVVRFDDLMETHLRAVNRRMTTKILHDEWLEP